MKKRRILLIAVLFLLNLSLVFAQNDFMSPEQKERYNLLKEQMPELKIAWNASLKTPSAISKIRSPSLRLTPEAVKSYFLSNFDLFYPLRAPEDLRVSSPVKLKRGFQKIVVTQTYRGVPVHGGMLNLNFNSKNQLISISGKWYPLKDLKEMSITPKFPEEGVIESIVEYLEKTYERNITPEGAAQLRPDRISLVIIDPGVHKNQPKGLYLAYRVKIASETFFVDAMNGEVLLYLTGIQEALDRETYNGNCLDTVDTPPGTLIIDESGPVGGAVPDAETQNAHDFSGDVYDYYFDTHTRDSYDGSGATIVSVVHSGVPQDQLAIICCVFGLDLCCLCSHMNAAWIGPPYNRILYGDGGTEDGKTWNPLCNALDAIAHEFTHGVTTYSIFDPATGDPAGLDYTGESGATNEALSDIFACMVDRDDWLIGEDVVVAGYVAGAMRNLEDPTNGGLYDPADPVNSYLDGHLPSHYDDRYTGALDNGGVHINSCIVSHAAHLMAEGGTHTVSGITVNAIGREATENIFYRMLTAHLTTTSTFLEARYAALTSVEELYPGDAAKYASVWNAFTAVGICDPGVPGECTPYAPIEGRDPVNIVLTLDYSDSMNSATQPGGRTKIEVLKDAVEIFLRTWEVFALPGDQVDLVYFSSDVEPLAVELMPLIGNVDDLVSEVRSRPTGMYTAMGGALQVALTGLSAPGTSHPAIIAFTNGIQNVNPMVVEVGLQFEIINSAGAWGGTSSVPENSGVSIDSYGIPIHNIGIGITVGTAYHELLNDISTETAGEIHLTDEPDIDLRQFYLEDLVTSLNLATVEMLAHRRGEVNQGQTLSESFDLDDGVTRAAFILHWKEDEAENLRQFKIKSPDNTEIVPNQWIDGDFYRMAVIDYPIYSNGSTINPAGEWKLYSEQPVNKNTPYQVTVLVDELDIHYDFSFGSSTWAGDPLILTGRITDARGNPIKNLNSMEVEIRKPKEPLGNVLATTKGSGSGELTDELSSPATIKLHNIMKDPSVRERLRYDRVVVQLNDQGIDGDKTKNDGVYSYRFSETAEPGAYRLSFAAKGETSQGIAFERTKTMGKILKLKPSPKKTDLLLKKMDEEPESRQVILRFTPKDENGYFLGPGYGERIDVELSGGEKKKIIDNLDGSYECEVLLFKSAMSARVSLKVSGVTLYDGFVSDFGKPERKIRLSIHAGTAVPVGSFGSSYNPGFLAEFDIEYRATKILSLEALIGYYQFSPSYSIVGGSLAAKGYVPLNRLEIYGQLGGGIYFPQNEDAAFGMLFGLGVQKALRSNMALDAGANYHKIMVPGNDYDFVSVKLGLKYRL